MGPLLGQNTLSSIGGSGEVYYCGAFIKRDVLSFCFDFCGSLNQRFRRVMVVGGISRKCGMMIDDHWWAGRWFEKMILKKNRVFPMTVRRLALMTSFSPCMGKSINQKTKKKLSSNSYDVIPPQV